MSEQAPARVAASSPVFPRQSGAKRLLAAARSNRAFQLTVLLALLLGTWLRLRGYIFDPPTLWLDEAFWAIRILEKPITQCRIRPVGFVYLTKWLVQAFGATETIYRALPCLASLSALWLMPYVAGGLMRRRWVVLLAVFLFAIHPVAIEMSVEFKHYGVEIGIFVVLLAAYVLHRRRQKAWSLALLLGLACLGVLFSFAVIFLYSALFLALAWEAIVRRRWKKLVAVAAGCAACLAAISAVYLLLWQTMSQPKQKRHFGHFYDVFYLESEPRNRDTSRLEWTLGKYLDLATVAGDGRIKDLGDAKAKWHSAWLRQEIVDEVSTTVGWIFIALHLAGICCLLLRRKYDCLLLLWSPLLWVMIFNALHRWPAGSFRTNTFYIPYSILLAMLGLDWIATWGMSRKRWALPAALTFPLRATGPLMAALIVVPALWFRPSWQPKGAKWTETGAFREVLQVLAENRPPPSIKRWILLDNSSSRPWDYYLHYDALLPEQTKQAVLQSYRSTWTWGGSKFLNRVRRLARARKGREFWVMTSKPHYYDEVFRAMHRHCGRVESTSVREHLILRCVVSKG